jgi:hypothetical protein
MAIGAPPFLGWGPINDLARCFAFAKAGELLGHLLDGHIIHLPSKPLSRNTDRDRVEKNCFELWPYNGIPLGTLPSLYICRRGHLMRCEECGPNKVEVLLRWIPPVPD